MNADEIYPDQKRIAIYAGIYLQTAVELIEGLADGYEFVGSSSERVAGMREAKEAIVRWRARVLASAGIEEKEGGDQ